MKSAVLKNLSLFFFLLISFQAFGTHNRAGEITYKYIGTDGAYRYEFTITTYTDPTSPADRDALVLYYGDGYFDTVPRVSEEELTSSIKKNTYISQHEYSAPATYTAYMQDPNRVDGIVNIQGSVNVPFYIETCVIVINPILYGYNSTPILDNPPIDYANIGEVFTHNPGAHDPDGDALRFYLTEPKQDPLNDVPGYEFPDDYTDDPTDVFSIDSITGTITWIVPTEEGIYVVAILIFEYRDNELIGCIRRDMQIEVLNNTNNAPVISEINDTCIFAGEDLVLEVTASDPDTFQELTLTAVGGPFLVETSPAEFFSDPSNGFVSGTFEWQTTCDHVRQEFYEAVFKVEDNYQEGIHSLPLTDQETWLIYVIAPPVQNVLAVADGNAINVSWDEPYSCESTENFLGFSVWRKINCDTVEFDECQRGLDGYGYDSIAFVEDAYSYIDNDVIHGQIYSYRILAEFGVRSPIAPQFIYNPTKSYPSNNSCAELLRDLPILNHVSVTTTDVSAGTIYVQWYHPLAEALDTIQNQPPYQYILKRYEGIDASGSATEVAEFNATAFYLLNDSVFNDSGLNTLEKQYTYTIDIYSENALLGTSEPASSVFLQSTPADNKAILSWSFNVPWLNNTYTIFKENPTGSGNFDSIAITTEQNYTDDSLANGVEVCYLIKAYGQFTAESLPSDTLINFSQIKCETPIDVEAPCPPVLTVENICETDEIITDIEELKNELSWTNPNNSCADDVIKYEIYYSSMSNGELILLDSILFGDDTTYTHKDLISLAGCYSVIAVDSFSNKSQSSNIVCVDNCADYNLPNVFTPNNDGANDLYTPILPYRFIDHVEMNIFDSWGNLVFNTKEPMLNWDGRNMNGKTLNEGVYYYVCTVFIITVNGVEQDPLLRKGYIHLIRSENTQ